MIDWAGSTNIQDVLLNLIPIEEIAETKSQDTVLMSCRSYSWLHSWWDYFDDIKQFSG